MKTKNIFKALAVAMLMPAMLLTTACSNEDDIVNNENTIKKGFELPVTINVTRQGDEGTTRASYNSTTKKLEFSTGDQLFILGAKDGDGMPGWFYGTLTWQSVGTFSGTLTTENEYTGTIDAIIGSSHAYLLPAGYDSYGFLTVSTGEGWNASVDPDFTKTFADTKAEAIEQFSLELGGYNSSSGYIELEPMMAILNFTITGLKPYTEYAVVLNNGSVDIGGDVTTALSGNATFAVGVLNGLNSQDLTLTVGGTPVALNLDGANNRTLNAGKIYNISRPATVDLSTVSGTNYTVKGDVIFTGTPTNSNFNIGISGECTVTLDNVNSAGEKTVRVTGYTDMNLMLKGTSHLQTIMSVQKSLTIDEAEAGGTVIVNNSASYAIAATTVTVNGGTVKAKSTGSLNAVDGNLVVNDGNVYLAGADGKNAVNGTITAGTGVTLYGWDGSEWGAATNVRYVTTDNTSGNPTTPSAAWTW